MFFQKEKIENGISYFIQNCSKTHKANPYKLYVYTFLAYVDFKHLEKYGVPVFDFTYTAMEFGPVPMEMHFDKMFTQSDLYEFVDRPKEEEITVRSSGISPDMDYFSENEMDIINDLIVKLKMLRNTEAIVDLCHNEIKPWEKAWNEKDRTRNQNVINWKEHIIPLIDSKDKEYIIEKITDYYSTKEYLLDKYDYLDLESIE